MMAKCLRDCFFLENFQDKNVLLEFVGRNALDRSRLMMVSYVAELLTDSKMYKSSIFRSLASP